MPTEDELRQWFRAGENESPSRRLDATMVIRRSKRRRLPGQVAVGGVVTLAVAGLSVGSIAGIRSILPRAVTDSSLSSGESAPQAPQGRDNATDRAPADRLNLCGAPVAAPVPSESGLILTPHFPASARTDGQITGTVTLTNTGATAITGTTAASPAVTVSQGGITLWHSNGPMIMLAAVVALEPGQSMDYPASITPVRCDSEDDLNGFRDSLPPLPAGQYQVSAAIDLTPDKAGSTTQLITGAPQTIVLQ